MDVGIDAETEGLLHAVFFYRDDREYLDTLVPFIRDGIDRGEPVFVALPPGKLALLRDSLGDTAGRVVLDDMAVLGSNPARTFAAFGALCADHPDRRVRMVAEPVWPGRTGAVYPACVQNEALWNTAFAAHRVSTVCPYDIAALPPEVIADARATHPLVWCDGAAAPSADYAAEAALARANEPLPAPTDAVVNTVTALAALPQARAFAERHGVRWGLDADRVGDLRLIVTELVTNSLKYTTGSCRIALWQSDGAVVCQVDDDGHIADPLAGRRLAPADATSGRGLFLVNALADLVRTHTGADGTAIRVYLRNVAPVPDPVW